MVEEGEALVDLTLDPPDGEASLAQPPGGVDRLLGEDGDFHRDR